MIIRHAAYRSICSWMMCASLLGSCRSHHMVRENEPVRMVEMGTLWDQTKSYVYGSEYYFFPMRPSRGSRFLDVSFDSASYTPGNHSLYVSGQVVQYENSARIQNVQVVVGRVLREEGQIIRNDSTPPIPSYHFRIIPTVEDTTDSEGRFALYAPIDSSSSLMIGTNSFHIELYDVGKLVDSAWTQ